MTKPPYRVPSMADIEALPWNGFRVASTFSGCGGSCLGYRMAGYRVVYANEFIEEAQRTYKANHPNSFLDTRDIRQVKPEDVLEKAGVDRGELDLFDGSPPCSAFSTAGKRERGWGQVKAYSDKAQRVDDLFFEYVRLLDGIRPKGLRGRERERPSEGHGEGILQADPRGASGAGLPRELPGA
jgi:Site-specific DNA methylase